MVSTNHKPSHSHPGGSAFTSGKLSELMPPSDVENCLRSAGSMYAEVHPITGMYRWFWKTSSSTTSAFTCQIRPELQSRDEKHERVGLG